MHIFLHPKPRIHIFQPFNGNRIWKLKNLLRIQTIIWMWFHNSLATRVFLAARGIQVNTICPICLQAPETIIHVLRNCPLASSCWQNLRVNHGPDFFSLDSRDWLREYGRKEYKAGLLLIPWNVIFVIFSFGLWTLWQHRNRVVFQSRTPNQAIHSVVITRAAEYFFCPHNQAAIRPRLEKVIRWVRSERGWFKINTDGSSIGNLGN